MAKAFFPRASYTTLIGVLIAGTVADFDTLSAQFSPSIFLRMNHTWGHSLLSAAVIGVMIGFVCLFVEKLRSVTEIPPAPIFVAMFCAAALHLLLDICQSDGAALLWPFSSRRFSWDWVPLVDIWIIFILTAGLLLPLLIRLVTDEIGVKSESIRGHREAIASLLIVALYISLRMVAHAGALSTLGSRSYGGDVARTAAALPASQSPFRWLGVVETESAWHLLTIAVTPGATATITEDRSLYKPEDSPGLAAARNSETAKQFLRHARFPKPTVAKDESDETRVILREAVADRYSVLPVVAVVDLDSSGKIVQEQLNWDSRTR